MTVMTAPQIRIVPFREALRPDFFEFAAKVRPAETYLRQRLEWFLFDNPFLDRSNHIPGLFAVTAEEEIIGQVLMNPFKFYFDQKEYSGYFGFDLFVKEASRGQGIGSLLLAEATRTFKPFVAVGAMPSVERIAQIAGVRSASPLRKFLWIRNPIGLGLNVIKRRVFKDSGHRPECEFPDSVTSSGDQFQRCVAPPESWSDPTGPDGSLNPARSRAFLDWRFFRSPKPYHVYFGEGAYLAVREAFYQGLHLLLIADYRFSGKIAGPLDMILRAAKTIARQANLDGVVMAASCPTVEEALYREGFFVAGDPIPVLVNLPGDIPADAALCLSMADAGADFNFGEPL